MAKTKQNKQADLQTDPETDVPPGLRERIELILFVAVEVVCLLLFVDFLFFGIYVK